MLYWRVHCHIITYYHGWTVLIPIAGFGAALITAFYMFRLIFLTFFGNPRNEKIYAHIHESPKAMTIPSYNSICS